MNNENLKQILLYLFAVWGIAHGLLTETWGLHLCDNSEIPVLC